MLLRIMNTILHFKAELDMERGNIATQLTAASSLLRLTCDAVIELDNKLCMTEHSPELASMLLNPALYQTLCDYVHTCMQIAMAANVMKYHVMFYNMLYNM